MDASFAIFHTSIARTKLFSHKTKGAPSPKARDFHEFFHSAEVNERLLTKKLVNIVLLL